MLCRFIGGSLRSAFLNVRPAEAVQRMCPECEEEVQRQPIEEPEPDDELE